MQTPARISTAKDSKATQLREDISGVMLTWEQKNEQEKNLLQLVGQNSQACPPMEQVSVKPEVHRSEYQDRLLEREL